MNFVQPRPTSSGRSSNLVRPYRDEVRRRGSARGRLDEVPAEPVTRAVMQANAMLAAVLEVLRGLRFDGQSGDRSALVVSASPKRGASNGRE